MNNHIQVTFDKIQPDQQDILIALLSETGYEGFEQEDHSLKAFIPQIHHDPAKISEIALQYDLPYTIVELPAQNWNAVWESNFPPVLIDDFVAIRAHFHQPTTNTRYEILITPKMSFGTGHHATTEMMVREMEKIELKDKRVLDFGTGTGVLAILASKMGAMEVMAIDNDEWSIINAKENIGTNHCNNIQLLHQDQPLLEGKFQVILANINRHVILNHFRSIVELLSHNGTLILSGILKSDREEIISYASRYNLRQAGENAIGEWICLRFSR